MSARRRFLAAALLCAAGLARPVAAQRTHDAAELDEVVRALGMTARVLMIAAHPDDEDTQLLAWLARGRGASTAYLSLTRGDGGQNLIGNELGEALGAIRTEELLAARRIDGARQYFTRAYDFGFSKTPDETFAHWPRDSVLGDVVRVVRAVRPHVIVAVFSGTPRDGHGHHQASGLFAREAYDAAGDPVRFPEAAYGPAWTPAKLYRSARFRPEAATLRFDVGGYNALRGRGYAELAGESRSQHKSQGFGVLQRKGAVLDYLQREATRVNAGVAAEAERDLFDGIDTSWTRVAAALPAGAAATLARAHARLAARLDLRRPARDVPAFVRAAAVARGPLRRCATDAQRCRDAEAVQQELEGRLASLMEHAAAPALEATLARGVVAVGDTVAAEVTLYNRGTVPLRVTRVGLETGAADVAALRDSVLAPGASRRAVLSFVPARADEPWWRTQPRRGDLWQVPITAANGGAPIDEEAVYGTRLVFDAVLPDGQPVRTTAVLVHRYADPVKGDQQRPVLAAPAVSLVLDRAVAYARAGVPFERTLRITVASAARDTQDVRVSLALPPGLAAVTGERRVRLAPGAAQTVELAVRGTLPPGTHRLEARAEVGGSRVTRGFVRLDYEHIRPLHLYRDAALEVTSVDVALPARTMVAYVPGVGDNVRPMLEDLGLAVTTLDPAAIPVLDPGTYGALVVGPRAFEASDALAAQRERLFDFARRGGTLVLQYGQYELTRPGALPYPVTIARPHDRVTEEDAAVRVLAPDHPLLQTPNRIAAGDFDGWVQERALYMPRTFDAAWTPLVSMHDAGEPPRESGLLVAPLGRGTIVYTSLAFFRQLPAGVPGAARLFVNLLAAGPPAPR